MNSYHTGFTTTTVLYSIGASPLEGWDNQVRNGHIKRITDQDIQSSVIEIMGINVDNNYISYPKETKPISIKLPVVVLLIKNVYP
jgi:hypothetical protein